MDCKRKSLIIRIALSFLLGAIVPQAVLTTKAIDQSFDTIAEVVYFYDYLLDLEETSVSEYNFFPEINEGDALRHFSPNKRVNNYPSAKNGLSSIPKEYLSYTSSIILESTPRFLSGVSEGRKRLIHFGILII